ncbi:MAG: hypothetical protein M3R24_26265 [Chloroflexota bacterium]|nr:hypothetical protein [Chloroflexota bacterium]
MEEYQRPEPPKLPKFEDEDELSVELEGDEDAQNQENEGTEDPFDRVTTVAFACLSCDYTKFIHYWRSNPDGLDYARKEYAELHDFDHEIVWTEYVFEE